mmetsp:Transcript_17472/g.36983  ORF Transcript_17472/g.36983 Transcript_17472/m.36983 type:complete len:222 (-) Transcript_17472:736-1401(-)
MRVARWPGAQKTPTRRRSSHVLDEDRVRRLVVEGVAKVVQHRIKSLLLALGHLDPGEHLADLPAVVAVVEQRDEPLLPERRQELAQRTGARLGELEPQHALACDAAVPPSGEVARMRLRHLVGGHVGRLDVDRLQRIDHTLRLLLRGERGVGLEHAHVNQRLLVSRTKAVDEFGDRARLHCLVHAEEGAALLGRLEDKQPLLVLSHGCALGDKAEDVELDV